LWPDPTAWRHAAHAFETAAFVVLGQSTSVTTAAGEQSSMAVT